MHSRVVRPKDTKEKARLHRLDKKRMHYRNEKKAIEKIHNKKQEAKLKIDEKKVHNKKQEAKLKMYVDEAQNAAEEKNLLKDQLQHHKNLMTQKINDIKKHVLYELKHEFIKFLFPGAIPSLEQMEEIESTITTCFDIAINQKNEPIINPEAFDPDAQKMEYKNILIQLLSSLEHQESVDILLSIIEMHKGIMLIQSHGLAYEYQEHEEYFGIESKYRQEIVRFMSDNYNEYIPNKEIIDAIYDYFYSVYNIHKHTIATSCLQYGRFIEPDCKLHLICTKYGLDHNAVMMHADTLSEKYSNMLHKKSKLLDDVSSAILEKDDQQIHESIVVDDYSLILGESAFNTPVKCRLLSIDLNNLTSMNHADLHGNLSNRTIDYSLDSE
ncbi:MAG: hypothetical protein AB8B67_04865 [Rickettsiaceae bacterium]